MCCSPGHIYKVTKKQEKKKGVSFKRRQKGEKKMSLRYCAIRSRPRRFGISFTVPDRVTSEINDKKRIMGKHPLRITRVPSGGPKELHNLIQEAENNNLLTLKKKKEETNNGVTKKLLNHKRAYHRSRFNDWYVEEFYFESFGGESQLPSEQPNSSGLSA